MKLAEQTRKNTEYLTEMEIIVVYKGSRRNRAKNCNHWVQYLMMNCELWEKTYKKESPKNDPKPSAKK